VRRAGRGGGERARCGDQTEARRCSVLSGAGQVTIVEYSKSKEKSRQVGHVTIVEYSKFKEKKYLGKPDM